MSFLFSSPINRLMFLARFIFTQIIFALIARFSYLISTYHADSALASPAFAFLGLIGVVTFVYYAWMGVWARLRSIGMSFWYSLGLIPIVLIPFGYVLVLFFTKVGVIPADLSSMETLACVGGFTYLLYNLMLISMPAEAFRHGSVIQAIMYDFEVDEGRVIIRLIPLVVALTVIAALYNFNIYRGLDDSQSMDNAQLARQIVRGEGFTTKFLRPEAISELSNYKASQNLGLGSSTNLFPPEQFPPGAPRFLPDTYNAPGYPCLLAAWFYLVRPDFNQSVAPSHDGFTRSNGKTSHIYSGDRWIPFLNLVFLLLTGLLVFILGRRLFDDRVAWLGIVAFFATSLVWQYSITALSTNFLMFLVTAALWCVVEIFCLSEGTFESEEHSFGWAWIWGIVLCFLLAAACLTRLHLLVLLVPAVVLFLLMPRPSWGLAVLLTLIVLAFVTPWFWHMYKVSGNPLGSNMSYVLFGEEGFKEDQIFRSTGVLKYESLFKDASDKEVDGFIWHLENGWHLLGSSPMIILFVASLVHAYKRRRAQMFQWFLVGCAIVIIAANNLGVTSPEQIDAWNTLIVLFPGMVVVGSAFFLIQLDRLNFQIRLLNSLLVTSVLTIATLPLVYTVSNPSAWIFSFPPYIPPMIKLLGQFSQQDEWVTSDMPWATAWYADRTSLWLPDTVSQFEDLHAQTCPTGMLIMTPATWMKPTQNILSGEDKDWFPVIFSERLPGNFPLQVHFSIKQIGYRVWSNRPRWQEQ